MADKTRQIGGLHSEVTERGTLYTVILFINNADTATFIPSPVGKPPDVTGQTGDSYNTQTGQSILPTASYIYQFKQVPTGDHWVFYIYACSTGYDWGGAGAGSVTLGGGTINRSFSQAEILLKPSWWGIIPYSEHQEFRQDDNPAGIKMALVPATAARVGTDLVFANATTSSPTGTVNGIYDPDCPFTQASIEALAVTYAGMRLRTVVYELEMYRASGSSTHWRNYFTWWGTNPAGASAFEPPSGCAPSTSPTLGTWRAVDQKVWEKVKKDSSSNYYDKVWRKMEYIPLTGLVWKYSAWTWGT